MPSLKITRPPAATTLEPATAGAPRPDGEREPEERVLTFGDVFGRDAGGLIVLLVLFGALTLASRRVPHRPTTWPTWPARSRSSGSSPSASCWSS